jgi:hypothetical protein
MTEYTTCCVSVTKRLIQEVSQKQLRAQLQRGRWAAKLVARLLATLLIQTSLKIKNGRQKQQSDQHTLARQKEKITEQSVYI